jgi:plastocyanin
MMGVVGAASMRIGRAFVWRLAVLACALPSCDAGEPVEEPPGPVPALLEQIARPVDGATVHLVRLVQHGDVYAFEPDEVRIPTGDVVRFVLAGGQPESIVFDAGSATPEAAAFIGEHSLNLGVLLTEAGQAYDVDFREAPPGQYPFLSLPHSVHGMRGVVVIESAG